MLTITYVRQEALRRWQKKLGLGATYRKLLEVFIQAGHTECAEALCQMLKIKCKYAHFYSHQSVSYSQYPWLGKKLCGHRKLC